MNDLFKQKIQVNQINLDPEGGLGCRENPTEETYVNENHVPDFSQKANDRNTGLQITDTWKNQFKEEIKRELGLDPHADYTCGYSSAGFWPFKEELKQEISQELLSIPVKEILEASSSVAKCVNTCVALHMQTTKQEIKDCLIDFKVEVKELIDQDSDKLKKIVLHGLQMQLDFLHGKLMKSIEKKMEERYFSWDDAKAAVQRLGLESTKQKVVSKSVSTEADELSPLASSSSTES